MSAQVSSRTGEIMTAALQPPWEHPNIRFPGQYHDDETGLHYNRFRYYDPSIGRYASADPVWQAGDLNRYRYGMGNPVMGTDPEGLAPRRRFPRFEWITCNADEIAECVAECEEIGQRFESCRRRVVFTRNIDNRIDFRKLGLSCRCEDDGGFCRSNPGKCIAGAALVIGACAAALGPQGLIVPLLLGAAAAGS